MKTTIDMQKYLKRLELEHEQYEKKWENEKKKRLEEFKEFVEKALLVVEHDTFEPRGIDLPLRYKADLSCEGSGGLFPYFPAEIFSIFARKGAETNFFECIKIYLDAFPLRQLIAFIDKQDQSFINLCGGLFLLFSAQSGSYMELMKLLLEKKVSPNATFLGQKRASPLQVLCSLMIFNEYGAKDFEVSFNLLIKHRAEIDYQNECGDTALMEVTSPCEFNPGFKLLLDLDANPCLANKKGGTAMSRVMQSYCKNDTQYRIQTDMLVQLEDSCIKHEMIRSTQLPKDLTNLVWSYRGRHEIEENNQVDNLNEANGANETNGADDVDESMSQVYNYRK